MRNRIPRFVATTLLVITVAGCGKKVEETTAPLLGVAVSFTHPAHVVD